MLVIVLAVEVGRILSLTLGENFELQVGWLMLKAILIS